MTRTTPLPRVAVLVDLQRHSGAGGHVRFWEQIGRVASEQPLNVRLDLHFRGENDTVEQWSQWVTVYAHRPVLSSERLHWLRGMPDSGDLAPWHDRLAARIADAQLLHCTDGLFAYAATARRCARRMRVPLVTSLHTDAVRYGHVYTDYAIAQLAGTRVAELLRKARVPGMVQSWLQRRLRRHVTASDWVMDSHRSHCDAEVDAGRSILRRGLDRTVFRPDVDAGRRLRAELGVPPKALLMAFTGRLSPGKQVQRVAAVVRALRARHLDVRAVFAGAGPELPMLRQALGPHGYFLGQVPATRVSAMLNAADLFLFPSQIEVWPNAVNEARACGVAVLVDADGGGRIVSQSGEDGAIAARDDASWVDAAHNLLLNQDARARMAARALAISLRAVPGWYDVLEQDLLPVWHALMTARAEAGQSANLLLGEPKFIGSAR